jgi:hypothetical protein
MRCTVITGSGAPCSRNSTANFFAPQPYWCRNVITCRSWLAAVRVGQCCGRRLRSATAAKLFACSNRWRHRYPVVREIPNNRHSAVMFSFPLAARTTNFTLCSDTSVLSQGMFSGLLVREST